MNSVKVWLGVIFLATVTGCVQSGVLGVSQEQPPISDDVDNDGVVNDEDCEPMNSDIYPGAEDICDGVDNDCDGDLDEDGTLPFYEDVDNDGFGNDQSMVLACTAPTNFVEVGGDCRDDDADSYPGADELCDGIDNDCDDEVPSDEVDTDVDRYVVCVDWIGNNPDIDGGSDCDELRDDVHPNADEPCDGPEPNVDFNCDQSLATEDADNDGYRSCEECDDSSAIRFPGNPEICDGVDNDCLDDVPADEADDDADGFRICDNDCNDAVDTIYPGAAEAVADGVDQDCDTVDDCYEDLDGDNHGTATVISGIDLTCMNPGKSTLSDDCDDGEVNNYPGNTEICDSIDNDCDGDIDDADSVVTGTTDWYLDNDGDLHGSGVALAACVAPADHVANNDDCDDSSDQRFPGNPEICDQLDNDCDTDTPANEADDDGDGYVECVPWTGSNPNIDGGDDCDDLVAENYPGNTEVCDSIDNDCDGDIDDADSVVTGTTDWYLDNDGDLHGSGVALAACVAPANHVASSDDCDDGEVNNYPGNTEVCDTIDNDCDGDIDDADSVVTGTTDWYLDNDGDTHGAGAAVPLCVAPANHVVSNDDCDDAEITIYTGAPELCDQLDNDCDTFTPADEADDDGDGYVECSDWVGGNAAINGGDDCDDGEITVHVGETRYFDADGDGYGDPNMGLFDCPTGFSVDYVVDGTDCNDAQAVVNPGVTEEPYTVWDDDCDGTAHGDGTTAYPTAGSDIFFTGPNLIANPTADSDFSDGVVQDWHVYISDEGYDDTDLTVTDTLWSATYLPAGTYPRYDIQLALTLRGGNSECSILGPFAVSVGQQYSVSFVAQSDNTLDNNTISVYSQTHFDTFVPALDVVNIPPFGGELSVVSTFVATVTSESIVICHGQVGSNGGGMAGGGGAGWTHVWFGESTY